MNLGIFAFSFGKHRGFITYDKPAYRIFKNFALSGLGKFSESKHENICYFTQSGFGVAVVYRFVENGDERFERHGFFCGFRVCIGFRRSRFFFDGLVFVGRDFLVRYFNPFGRRLVVRQIFKQFLSYIVKVFLVFRKSLFLAKFFINLVFFRGNGFGFLGDNNISYAVFNFVKTSVIDFSFDVTLQTYCRIEVFEHKVKGLARFFLGLHEGIR